ncbi:hypothetical protein [Brachybacterium sp. GCM10030252]|uniref:hypothetical protein n=1 Tax=Brachybacterium sp. GCM10030252 TaxID=3273380 RepID=UPI00361912D2
MQPPSPRRTRGGAVLVGPSLRARYVPGALIGLPLVSVLLAPFAGAALQQWRRAQLTGGHDSALADLLAPAWVQLLLGAVLLWALFALWALVPMLLTHRVVHLDERAGTLLLRRGLHAIDRADLRDVDHAVGEAERGSIAVIGIRGAGTRGSGPVRTQGAARAQGAVRDRETADGETPVRQWIVPEIGWDSASFDGLRALQAAAGLRPAPSRAELVAENRRVRRAAAHRELADRLGMPWKDEYAHDEAAFQEEFDRVRRVLGGKEPPREGDPRP